jgi:hypothetical protein
MTSPLQLVRTLQMGNPDTTSVIAQVAEWPTSEEMATVNPLLDEWVLMARTITDMIMAFADDRGFETGKRRN